MKLSLDKKDKLILVISAIAVALLLSLVGAIIYANSARAKGRNWEHNYRVLQDSVEVVTTKYGEVLYERGSLILEKKELEEALGLSKKQIKDYEKTLNSKLAYISKLESQLEKKDTVTITVEKIIHDTLTNSYTGLYRDKWLSFNQRFTIESPTNYWFDSWGFKMNVPLKVGLTDNYTIFVQSDNPYFSVSEIEGAVIDKGQFTQKPRRFVIIVYAGFGAQYGLIHRTFDVGPQLGFGLGIRVW